MTVETRFPAIRTEGLSKRFGDVPAVQGLDLELAAGSSMALLGTNGAGKTTTVRMLTTLLRPDGGRAWIAGWDVAEHPDRVRHLIGLSGQFAAVDAYLTGRENLRMIARLYGRRRADAGRRTDDLIEGLGLEGAADRPARTYSGGMRRRLDIAAALVGAPRVLFLDEPTTGLDPHGRLAVWELVEQLVADGTSLLLTTQHMDEADRLAERVIVLREGRPIAEGSPAELKAQLGGYRLEVGLARDADASRAAAALVGCGPEEPRIDVRTNRVIVQVSDALALLPDVRRRLADAGSEVTDLALRRPTLDEVFLTLTGATADPGGGSADPGRLGGSGPRGPAEAAPRASAVVATAVLTGRNLLRLVRVPTLIAFATVQPVAFVLLFTFAFGGALAPGGEYIDYVLPGLLVLAIGFGASQTGVAVAEDFATGMTDRFRSLPIPGRAVLAGKVAADAARNLFVVGLMLGIGALLGFRFHAGPAAALAVVGLAVATGVALSWLNVLLGLVVRDAESAGLAGLFPVIILFFTSSTLVPIATMPSWLQAFAKVNPITVVVDALRALVLGGPTARPALEALAWIAAILAITVPSAVRRYTGAPLMRRSSRATDSAA